MVKLGKNDIEAFIEIFNASDWNELSLTFGDVQLFLSEDINASGNQTSPFGVPEAVEDIGLNLNASPSQKMAASQREEESRENEVPEGMVAIRALNLGIFYSRPGPEKPPFVECGQSLEPDSEVCVLEVMKLFTTLLAGVAGVVRKICVSDGDLIEHDQILFIIEPTR